MKTQELELDGVRRTVRETYGKVAGNDAGCGCAPTCCGRSSEDAPRARDAAAVSQGLGYSAEQTGAVPAGANLGLGCGNPQAIAALRPGETVLDLGSGAGFRTVPTGGRAVPNPDGSSRFVARRRQTASRQAVAARG